MLIVYEKEVSYFEKLKAYVDKPTTKLFVSRVRNIDETGLLSPTILIQAKIGEDLYMLRYTGDLPKFQIVSNFDGISSDALKESVQKDYNESYIVFEKKLDDEYTKLVTLLATMGYTSIENAVVS